MDASGRGRRPGRELAARRVAIRAAIEEKYAAQLQQAGFLRGLWLEVCMHWEIFREMRRAREKAARGGRLCDDNGREEAVAGSGRIATASLAIVEPRATPAALTPGPSPAFRARGERCSLSPGRRAEQAGLAFLVAGGAIDNLGILAGADHDVERLSNSALFASRNAR